MNPYHVILRPIVTEKSVRLKEDANQVVFAVRLEANKAQIRKAVEDLFKVHVVDVRTARVAGKVKRRGRNVTEASDWKRAVVELRSGDAIEFFEQA
ncbi:MAG: 50S ribosomal protein L23 [Deltaproteobacteria bacterium]|jgi:large subunit ribosomal protein L23|nr:50S ribosomal protein L23 [Deltaproteobacteria bacterium]